MDNTPEHSETEIKLNHAIAESQSLKALLEEYLYIISVRDKEIESLRQQVNEKIELRSNADTQDMEFRLLQDSMHQLKIRAAGLNPYGVSNAGNEDFNGDSSFKFEGLQQQVIYLQTQITDLQEQLSEVNNRNLILQQEAGKVGELENQLENLQLELYLLKQKSLPGE